MKRLFSAVIGVVSLLAIAGLLNLGEQSAGLRLCIAILFLVVQVVLFVLGAWATARNKIKQPEIFPLVLIWMFLLIVRTSFLRLLQSAAKPPLSVGALMMCLTLVSAFISGVLFCFVWRFMRLSFNRIRHYGRELKNDLRKRGGN